MQSFLAGIEVDFQGTTANASRSNWNGLVVPAGNNGTFSTNASLAHLGTVRARLGVLVSPTLLAYVTGGLAFGEIQRSYGISFAGAPVFVAGRSRSTDTGWTAGAGLEWALGNRVTLGAEYLYVDLDGGDSFAATMVNGANLCTAANCNFGVRASDLETHIARVKVNFKF